MEGLLLFRNKNPFFQETGQGEPPSGLPMSFTHTPFPKMAFSIKELVANLHPNLITPIQEDPFQYLTVITFGAGKKFDEDNPMAGALFTEFIKMLGLNLGDLAIAKATPASTLKTDFGTPWIYILEGGSDTLQSLLLWQQTFIVNPMIAFSVVSFDHSTCSWVIANISDDFVSEDPKKMCQALGVIKEIMWNNWDFRGIMNQCLATANVTTTPLECAF